MVTPQRLITKGGELVDYPGWYKIDGRVENEAESWSVVRKPDGTWWWVVATHIFPVGGGNVHFELGDQIKEPETLSQCEDYFIELVQKVEEKKMKEGDRVRVIGTGVTGVIKGFGSLPGVPKVVNVKYDGGGGCNHMPDELEVEKSDSTPTPR